MSKFLLRYLFKSRVIVKLETMSRHHTHIVPTTHPPQGVSSNTTVSLSTLGETVSVIGDVSRPSPLSGSRFGSTPYNYGAVFAKYYINSSSTTTPRCVLLALQVPTSCLSLQSCHFFKSYFQGRNIGGLDAFRVLLASLWFQSIFVTIFLLGVIHKPRGQIFVYF